MSEEKHYYAFISHSSEDEKTAKWLCKQLEGYRIPTVIQKEYHAPKRLKPIFLYEIDLSKNVLKRALESELIDSQYLIVICSPMAAKSTHVNDEVLHFINSGRYDKIIPFIIGGTPYASKNGGSENECFPPALVALKGTEQELRGIDFRQEQKDRGSKKAAVIDVIASMLGVRMDVLWDRYKRHKIRQYAIGGIFALLLLLFGLFGVSIKNRQLMEIQARAVAEKAVNLINEGDSRTAQRILLEVLPIDINDLFDRPFVIEAEAALRKSEYCKEKLLDITIPNFHWVVVSPNGKHIAYQSRSQQLYDCSGIYNVDSRELNTLNLASYNINAIFSPKGDKVAFFTTFGTDIDIYDVNTFEEFGISTDNGIWIANPYIFSPQGDKIVYYKNGIAKVEDFVLDEQICTLVNSSKIKVEGFVYPYFSPDGKEIISSLGDKIVVWDSQTGEILRSFDAPSMLPSFSPDGKSIIYTYITKYENEITAQSVKIIDAYTGIEIKTFPAPHSTNYAFYSPTGKWVVIVYGLGDNDFVTKVGIYDALTGDSITTIRANLQFPSMCSFSPDDKQFFYIAQDKTIRIFDIVLPYELLSWNTYKNNLNLIRYSPDGDIAVSCSNDGCIVLWDVESGQKQMSFKHNKNIINDVAFCPVDPNILVSCSSKSGNILIWDISQNQVVDSLIGHSDVVNSVRFSSNGEYLISASDDCDVIIWDFPHRNISKIIKGYKTEGYSFSELSDKKLCAELSPNGKNIALLKNKSLIIKDIISGDTIQIFHACDSVFSVNTCFTNASFNHKGDLIVSASDDNAIIIWNVETGHQIWEMLGHKDVVNSVSFSSNDKYIISTSKDGSAKIWDVATGTEMCTYMFENILINSADFSPDEGKVIIALSNGMIKVIEFPTIQELIDSTRMRFKDYPLTPVERRKYYLE